MNPQEAAVLLSVLRLQCGNEAGGCSYAEWGSGGSTELIAWLIVHGAAAFNTSIREAVSVESSAEFVASMRRGSRHIVSAATRRGTLRVVHADIGPTGALGYPLRAHAITPAG